MFISMWCFAIIFHFCITNTTIRHTLDYWHISDVIFIVGPEWLGPKRLGVRSPWYLSNPLTRVYWTLYPWYIEPPTNASQYFLLRSTNRYVWLKAISVFSMFISMWCFAIIFHFCITNTTIRHTLVYWHISQSDCASLKPKNFHTGELCEPAETKVLFLHHVCLVCYLTCGELAFWCAC
jgi:hypothetical protein